MSGRSKSRTVVELEIPSDQEMEQVASSLHANREPNVRQIGNVNVVYQPSRKHEYEMIDVDIFTGKHGKKESLESELIASCVFSHGLDWQVCYAWNKGDQNPPERIQEKGEIVPFRPDVQRTLFDDDRPVETALEQRAEFIEGTLSQSTLNRHERNQQARMQCIAFYGSICTICGFDFQNTYGDIANGFIHVHHLTPLCDSDGPHTVDPIDDLRPVCPNCHAVFHMRDPPFSVSEILELLDRDNS